MGMTSRMIGTPTLGGWKQQQTEIYLSWDYKQNGQKIIYEKKLTCSSLNVLL